jgi:hypothetical protein
MIRKSFDLNVELKQYIESFYSNKNTSKLLHFYKNKYNVPIDITDLYLKQRTSRSFIMRSKKFDFKLSNLYIFISIIKYFIFLVYTLLLSKKKKSSDTRKFELLIDLIANDSEIERWLLLEREFTFEQTRFIASCEISNDLKSKHNISIRKPMQGYDRQLLLRLLFRSFMTDIFFLVKNSFNTGLNLVHINNLFVNDYLYYSNLFNEFKAKFMIQDRNLGMTNALKNFLFKKSGGILSACTQKNIVQHNANSLFFDSDILFSLGENTAEDLFDFGARIDHVVPVGSLSMESMYSQKKFSYEPLNNNKKINILYIGINAVNQINEDVEGYYESLRWLTKISNAHPELGIYIKHHPSWRSDPREANIINESSISYLDKFLDSYQLAFESNLIVTYGSTMGYELIGCGHKVLFLDPHNMNPFLIDSLNKNQYVIKDYNYLENIITNIDKIVGFSDKEKYCLLNITVSQTIYNFFQKNI